MTLRGHNEPNERFFGASQWELDVTAAYALIRSRFPELPPFALGYSIGGLLLTKTFDSDPYLLAPRGMILLAPAISMTTLLDISAGLQVPPPVSWSFPSLTPSAYRRYDLTPFFWYSNALALYTTMDSIKNAARLKEIKTLVLLNPNDELVSESGTRRWIEEHHLAPEWRVEIIQPSTPERFLREHLIIDEHSLGPSEWSRLKSLVSDFLQGLSG
jgi:esterase/lipase